MIPDYRKILYATDLTDNAAHAFRHAISLARRYKAVIHILHVLPEVEPAMLNYIATVMGEDRLADHELEHKQEVADRIRLKMLEFAREELIDHPEDIQRIADVEVHHGNPTARILEMADRIDADLVVLGSHGKGRLQYAFLGSVAEKLLRKSQRPALIVPIAKAISREDAKKSR